jgi:hypothetical protein
MTYAAYLRIYEPVSAFHEPERSRWAACVALVGSEASVSSGVAGQHAYVRRADGISYVCPWRPRLHRLPACDPAAPEPVARRDPARLHVRGSAWTVPLTWFALFAASERRLSLGPREHRASVTATAYATRALRYTTAMSRARRRAARALAAVRAAPACREAAWDVLRAEADLAEAGRWLEEFHPYSLVELDYGGLVQLISDDALSGDQSVAEIGAAVAGLAKGQYELATTMFKRAHNRWRAFAGLEQAN